jgi:FdhD protein|tara:strand:+ start:33935 stop:34759 length:825 start_codon:yes stop_codon:yes gene_type:complete
MATSDYEAKKFENDQASRIMDTLTVEEALQININGEPFTVTMRTPGDDLQLVRGLLHSEGIINDSSYSPEVIFRKDIEDGILTRADLNIPESKIGNAFANSRSLLSVSSCGICGRKELDELSSMGIVIDEKRQIHVSMIQDMFNQMNVKQSAFRQSGGSHAAAAFTFNGELLSSKEDIGRHNAVDKVVGDLILNGKLKEAAAITVSGRISYEIIIKAFKSKIPVLCAVSAPSSLAVDYAKELGITLLAFCRENRSTCYSNPHRINTSNLNSIAG